MKNFGNLKCIRVIFFLFFNTFSTIVDLRTIDHYSKRTFELTKTDEKKTHIPQEIRFRRESMDDDHLYLS